MQSTDAVKAKLYVSQVKIQFFAGQYMYVLAPKKWINALAKTI